MYVLLTRSRVTVHSMSFPRLDRVHYWPGCRHGQECRPGGFGERRPVHARRCEPVGSLRIRTNERRDRYPTNPSIDPGPYLGHESHPRSFGKRGCGSRHGGAHSWRTVKDLASGSGIEFVDQGVSELKGVQGEWRLFRVLA
jgi:hypothetical protein